MSHMTTEDTAQLVIARPGANQVLVPGYVLIRLKGCSIHGV
jgi:hypothetical protein